MKLFEQAFGAKPLRTSHTPGRVNLLGEWIDFSGGLVLPMALPLQVTIAASPNGSEEDVVVSEAFEGEARFSVDAPKASHWADYVRGALQAARRKGWAKQGFNVALASEVPHGSGLSTSAAVCVGTLRAVRAGAASAPETTEFAVLAREVENVFIGVPCGIMDQMAVAHAQPGNVLALETGSLEFEQIELPKSWHISVIHSGVSRELADGRYAERRNECLAAADAMGIVELCHGDLDAIRNLASPFDKRARHVISEDVRTRAARDGLKANDRNLFGELMIKGHNSIRDDFEIVPEEVDAIVSDAVQFGADGARQTGGGFGGCIVALMESGTEEVWWEKLSAKYPKATRVI